MNIFASFAILISLCFFAAKSNAETVTFSANAATNSLKVGAFPIGYVENPIEQQVICRIFTGRWDVVASNAQTESKSAPFAYAEFELNLSTKGGFSMVVANEQVTLFKSLTCTY